MKIKGTCRHCGRGFMIEQVAASGGRCPWCGKAFQNDYAAVLVDSLRDAEVAGNALENALEKLADLDPAFVLDGESITAAIHDHLDRIEKLHAGR